MAYATVAQLRALDGLTDVAAYPDATLQEGIDWATVTIDDYCGTSFEHKAFSETLDGTGCDAIRVATLFPRTLTSVTVDGVVQTTTGWALRPEGIIIRSTGSFTYTHPGMNVVVAGTAGYSSSAPADIAWACRTLARQYALDLHSRLPDRALSMVSDLGTIALAQAGGPNRPTSLPDVNAVLNRPTRYHRAPRCF